MTLPSLKRLHSANSLSLPKLDQFRRTDTDAIIVSLKPGQPGSLKVRPDGTIVDGHHRIEILRERGVDVDALPREVIPKNEPEAGP